ncbi:hypothetical protein PENSPDRAFT_307538 [Peniophora sp. CONT]|nr:hypothetical protein PENSPDRAFT_307538 [Peniophora sp. CONT]
MSPQSKTATNPLEELRLQAEKAIRIVSINKLANERQADVIRQALAQRNAKPRARRTFRDKFFEIRRRRGVSPIDLDALDACPPGNRHAPPVILVCGPSPTVLPPLYKDMTAITHYGLETDIQIKYYMQLREYYASLPVQQPTFVPSHVWPDYVRRKPAPAVDTISVQGWINYAPCPAPAKRAHDESDSYSRQPAKRARHSFSASTAPCNQ